MKTKISFMLAMIVMFFVVGQQSTAQEKSRKTPQKIKETQANYDAMIADIKVLALNAQEYYKKSLSQKGGGNKFTGWIIPSGTEKTLNGTYTAKVEISQVTIVGVGKMIGHDEKNNIRVTAVVGPKGIKSLTINN